MPSRTKFTRRAVLLSQFVLILAGCGGGPDFKPIEPDEQGLKELAAKYRGFFRKNKRGPKNLQEFQGKGQDAPNAVQMMKAGELIVQWGAPLSQEGENPDAVLAYVKTAPEQGGGVLMQDGKTIKKMTADEFRSAPKATGR